MSQLVLASHLLKLPVGAADVAARVGYAHDILVDIETGRFEGITIRQAILRELKFVSAQDIVAIDTNGITIKNLSQVVAITEVVRAKNIWQQKIRLIGLPVVTQSGKRLGKVSDLVISLQTNKVVKLYVSSLFNERVIPWHKIIKIERKKIIVDDDMSVIKVGALAQPEGI